MKASIVDLRYKTKDILKALDRKESVTVLYHGKIKGVIKPAGAEIESKISDHLFFGMNPDSSKTVSEELEDFRKARYNF